MGSEEEIVEALAVLAPMGFRKVPAEGRWRKKPPFRELVVGERTTAVVCEDPDISAVVVDRSSGEVLLVDPDGATHLVNRSLPQLVACSQVLQQAWREAMPAEDDETLEAIASRALAGFREIESDAVQGENQIWSVAAEELGYGL